MQPASGMTGIGSTGSTVERSGLTNALDPDEFLKLLLTELRHQNPLEPMKNDELLSQLTQIQNLEAMTSLSEGFKGMMRQQQVLGAGALIGRWVSGLTSEDGRVSGLVEGVRVVGKDVNLEVGDQLLPLGNIEQVGAAPEDKEAEHGS